MRSFENRRQFTRAPIKVEVEVTSGNTTVISSKTRDVSMKGIYLVCDRVLPVGSDCRVTLFLGGRQSRLCIEAKAKVARADDVGMGVEFIEIVGLESYDHLCKLVLYNALETEQVEQEFESHLGIKRR